MQHYWRKQAIEEKDNDLLMKLSKDSKYYEIKLSMLNPEKSESLEAAENFYKKIKEIRKKEHSIITKKDKKKHTETTK